MFNILKMAAKNILRNKRRTILIELMLVVGIVVILFTAAFLQSMSRNWRDAIVNADLGHFQIMQEGYRERRLSFALDYAIQDVDRLVAEVSSDPEVIGVTKRISVGGLISTGKDTAPFFARGFDINSAGATLPRIYSTLIEGEPLSDSVKGGAIVAEGLAKLLNAKIGDRLMLATYDKYKAMNAIEITIQGITKIPEDISNNSWVFIDYQTAKSLVSFDNEATEIVVRTSDFAQLEKTMNRIQASYVKKYNLEFSKWSDLASSFNQVEKMFTFSSMVVSGIIYVVVLIGLTNTILMSVFERTSEIGTLMAIGSSRLRITTMFIAEGMWLGIVGGLTGIFIHYGIISWLSKTGISVPPPPGSSQGFTLYPLLNWNDVISVCCTIILVAIVAAIYPSRFASRLNPIDAIRSL